MAPNLVSNHLSLPSLNGPISRFSLSDSKITIDGVTLLSDVPANVNLNSFSTICPFPYSSSSDNPPPSSLLKSVLSKSNNGLFLGFTSSKPSNRVLNPIGKLINRRFMSIFRFKTWWSTMWVGNNGSELQMETQLILLRIQELDSFVLVLPLIEGNFRSAIHPSSDNSVILCAESGSTKIRESSFKSIAYFHVGDNPFDLMREAVSTVRVHLGTFKLLQEKTLPGIIDKFGWCTWDAFYLTVEPVGVWHGVKSFVDNGLPPRFLIIDDGWQSINQDDEDPFSDAKDLSGLGSQMLCRLYRFEENEKFRSYCPGKMLRSDAPGFDQGAHDEMFRRKVELAEKKKEMEERGEDLRLLREEVAAVVAEAGQEVRKGEEGYEKKGLKGFVDDLKEKFKGLDDIYVWHAMCGAWGGVRPGTTHLDSKITSAKLPPCLERTMDDLAVVMVIKGGIGLVNPNQAFDFYDSMHSYLAKVGITGVKVDVIQVLEYVSEDHGGRVQLAKAYYDGLSRSLMKNFNGNGMIASMEQCNDFFFLATKKISMGRVGDDFWFEDPNGDPMGVYWLQGVHMIHCSYNSLWQGQFVQPDWDMFQSDHLCAEFHASSRAICGGPIYVSDNVGHHNFVLLSKLVLPDGTILRCQHFALPTRDCLFKNPLFDGKTALKIWNINKFTGVVGAFNCQGAGWYPEEHKCKAYPQCFKTVSGSVSPTDVEWEQVPMTARFRHSKEFVVFLNKSGDLCLLNSAKSISFTLQSTSFEIFTFSPAWELGPGMKFAPIGLENMFNSGGAIDDFEYGSNGRKISVRMKIKGVGTFLAYSSEKPGVCILNGDNVEFEWVDNGRLVFGVPWNGGALSNVLINF